MDGKSLDIIQEQKQKLKELFPEAFSEDKIDWEKLRSTLGEDISFSNERYVLNWAGKSDAFRVLQSPSTATLIPDKDESMEFDKTGNLFLEGENLEVLKILQRSYHNKIKVIYIDPPYNTGNDSFIYPDKFSETKEEYMKRIGSKDENGYLTREGLFRKNSRDSGHYHSNWLSMMYPRLFLAKNLLQEEGVIFISIDDNEVHNLKLLMNEIFGEENFIANIVWQKKQSPQNDAIYLSDMHDHILVYAKKAKSNRNDPWGWQRGLFPRGEAQNKRYENPDNDPRGNWTSVDCTCNKTSQERPNLYYSILNPKNNKEVWPSKQRVWRFEKSKMASLLKDNRIYWGSDGDNFPRLKRFRSEVRDGIVPSTWWDRKFAGDNQMAKREIRALFSDLDDSFDTPKPVLLIKRFLQISTEPEEDSIVLDFFAGSATTAQAVLEINSEDNGSRRFICVQLPELIENGSVLHKAGYKNVADIGKERIRRVIKKMAKEKKDKPRLFKPENGSMDLGFGVFKLHPSNFKSWRSKIDNGEELLKQVSAFEDPVKSESKEENMVYELILKSGRSLTSKIEKKTLNKTDCYVIDEGDMIFVLSGIDQELIKEIIKQKPKKVIALDKLFKGNDQLKTNSVLQMKDAGIDFKTI